MQPNNQVRSTASNSEIPEGLNFIAKNEIYLDCEAKIPPGVLRLVFSADGDFLEEINFCSAKASDTQIYNIKQHSSGRENRYYSICLTEIRDYFVGQCSKGNGTFDLQQYKADHESDKECAFGVVAAGNAGILNSELVLLRSAIVNRIRSTEYSNMLEYICVDGRINSSFQDLINMAPKCKEQIQEKYKHFCAMHPIDYNTYSVALEQLIAYNSTVHTYIGDRLFDLDALEVNQSLNHIRFYDEEGDLICKKYHCPFDDVTKNTTQEKKEGIALTTPATGEVERNVTEVSNAANVTSKSIATTATTQALITTNVTRALPVNATQNVATALPVNTTQKVVTASVLNATRSNSSIVTPWPHNVTEANSFNGTNNYNKSGAIASTHKSFYQGLAASSPFLILFIPLIFLCLLAIYIVNCKRNAASSGTVRRRNIANRQRNVEVDCPLLPISASAENRPSVLARGEINLNDLANQPLMGSAYNPNIVGLDMCSCGAFPNTAIKECRCISMGTHGENVNCGSQDVTSIC